MKELIERLEAATGPDLVLNARIWCATHNQEYVAEHVEQDHHGRLIIHGWNVPHYTASIDAALTLFPEWASFELTESAAGPPTFTRVRLWDWRRSPLMSDPSNEWKSEGNRPLPVNACIAALKARAASTPPRDQGGET